MKIFKICRSYSGIKTPEDLLGFVITSDKTDKDQVFAAWSYAVRYTARGLDLPDYDEAFALIQRRHPSWQYGRGTEDTIWYVGHFAENDKPE